MLFTGNRDFFFYMTFLHSFPVSPTWKCFVALKFTLSANSPFHYSPYVQVVSVYDTWMCYVARISCTLNMKDRMWKRTTWGLWRHSFLQSYERNCYISHIHCYFIINHLTASEMTLRCRKEVIWARFIENIRVIESWGVAIYLQYIVAKRDWAGNWVLFLVW